MEVSTYIESTKPEQVSYRQLLDLLRKQVAFDEAFLVALLLRGTLQVVQPPRLAENVLRMYDREGQRLDTLSWEAIRTQKPVLAGTDRGDFGTKFMAPLGFGQVVVIPLASPLMGGLPGALHIYRNGDQEFTDADVDTLREFATQLDQLHATVQNGRKATGHRDQDAEQPAGLRFAIFSANGSPLDFAQGTAFDESTLMRMAQMTKDRLNHAADRDLVGDRVLIGDKHGDHLTYRAVTYNAYPALGEGRFVGYFSQPDPSDLAALKSTDVAADPELSRLVPALRFMHSEFRKSPTLVDTAKTVHLSPFHFHRRFTELLGLTPKHYLLDCQITDAKKELLAGTKDLATIAADGGFAHQSHFTSRFKQATGQTPTRWRRMALSKGNAPE